MLSGQANPSPAQRIVGTPAFAARCGRLWDDAAESDAACRRAVVLIPVAGQERDD